jgi:iron(III) transport system permease protein
MRGRRWQEPVTFAAAASVVVVCAGVPLAALPAEGVGGAAVGLLSSSATWSLLAWSIATSAAVMVIALALGVPLGVLLGRTDVAGRGVALLIHAFSTFLPPFLLALGWFHVFGREGIIGGDTTSRLLFSPAGDVLVLGLAFAPIVTVLTVLGVGAIDPSLEDAARLVARPGRVAIRILLPIAWPGIALAALVVFALAFSELGVPMFLRVRAYPVAVFARLGGVSYAPGEAFVLVLPQLAVALVLLWLERRIGGRRALTVLGLRRDRAPLRLGRSRLPLTVACWSVVLLGALPLASLALRARAASWGDVGPWVGSSIGNGLVDAAAAATAIAGCGIVLGHGLARGQPAARAIDGLTFLAFVTAAAALGAGLIAAWSRPATQVVYASSAIVVVGYVARYGVLGVRPIAIAIARASAHLEDAAATVGAGYLRRLVRIVIPIHARAIAAAWLLAMVFCLRDLETAVLYYPPGGETLPVRIFTLEANGPPATVAALAVLHVAITAAVLALGLVLLGSRRRST